jgi:hypothetical protein
MVKFAPQYAVFGQMEGDIFHQVLEDLRREGWNAQANHLEAKMRARESLEGRSGSVWKRNAVGFELNRKTGVIRVGFAPATQYLHAARLRSEQPAKAAGLPACHPGKPFNQERGAYVIPLGRETTWVDLVALSNHG